MCCFQLRILLIHNKLILKEKEMHFSIEHVGASTFGHFKVSTGKIKTRLWEKKKPLLKEITFCCLQLKIFCWFSPCSTET